MPCSLFCLEKENGCTAWQVPCMCSADITLPVVLDLLLVTVILTVLFFRFTTYR
uniref:Uncharacterized protein n=1 Tax=Anguilla anguilla TaxID=7936 RepID=A0A0E9TAC4_ANGAN